MKEESRIVIPSTETLGDVFNIPKYKRTVMGEIEETRKAINKSSVKLKRTAFIVLDEKGCLKLPYLNDEYLKIQNRNSNHSKSERNCIVAIVEGAIHETLLYVEDLKQKSVKQIETRVPEVAKPRKPRTKKVKDDAEGK